MSLGTLIEYPVYFSKNGYAHSGLSPIVTLHTKEDWTYVSGIVAEVGSGWYKLYVSGTDISGHTVVGNIDGVSTELPAIDRFIPVCIDQNDYALDAFISDVPTAVDTQLSSVHGTGSWAAGSTGVGEYAITITVDDGTNPIAGVMVKVYNSDETTLIGYVATSPLGVAGFNLDAGTYSIRLSKYSIYTFTNPQTLVVSADAGVTYHGTLIVPDLAPTPETCVVTGRCLNGTGDILAHVNISANAIGDKLVYKDASGNETSVASGALKTTSDSNGVWSLVLIRSAYLYKGGIAGVKYHFKLKGSGLDEEKDVTIPDAASAKYEDL